jgi:hypothetical protein
MNGFGDDKPRGVRDLWRQFDGPSENGGCSQEAGSARNRRLFLSRLVREAEFASLGSLVNP